MNSARYAVLIPMLIFGLAGCGGGGNATAAPSGVAAVVPAAPQTGATTVPTSSPVIDSTANLQFVQGTQTHAQVNSLNGDVDLYFPTTGSIERSASATLTGLHNYPSSLPAVPGAHNYGALIKISNASMTIPFAQYSSSLTLSWTATSPLQSGSSWQTAWYNPQSSSAWKINSDMPATYFGNEPAGAGVQPVRPTSDALGTFVGSDGAMVDAPLQVGETLYIVIYN